MSARAMERILVMFAVSFLLERVNISIQKRNIHLEKGKRDDKKSETCRKVFEKNHIFQRKYISSWLF